MKRDAFDVVRCERVREGWRVDGRAHSDVALGDSLACLECAAAMPVLALGSAGPRYRV